MNDLQLGEIETRFAGIIWKNEPLTSMDLAKICEQELGWKRSTTYTVLRKLCEKGIFRNERTIVTSCMTEQEFHAKRSAKFVEDTYDGSFPAFMAAFTQQKKLSPEDVAEIRRMIDSLDTEPKS